MGRHLLAAAVAVVDVAVVAAGARSPAAVAGHALVVVAVVLLRRRAPVPAFVAALALATVTGSGLVLLLWAAYQAGRSVAGRAGYAVVAGAAAGGLAATAALRAGDARLLPQVVTTYTVLVALPLLAGCYVAQHERLVAALDRHNRQLRWQQALLAERERLRERLRIARDVHDRLGHRLSLLSVQAAALEVTAGGEAVARLGAAARSAMDELYGLVGTLRGTDGPEPPDLSALDALVDGFRSAGVPVSVRHAGEPLPLPAPAGQAAYRVVAEGLTNAAKHAPGEPVTVALAWEPDALLVTVENAVVDGPAAPAGSRCGLAGLSELVRAVDGLLDHEVAGARFRLYAMIPAASPRPAPDPTPRGRTFAIGLATAVLMFGVLPASMMVGVR